MRKKILQNENNEVATCFVVFRHSSVTTVSHPSACTDRHRAKVTRRTAQCLHKYTVNCSHVHHHGNSCQSKGSSSSSKNENEDKDDEERNCTMQLRANTALLNASWPLKRHARDRARVTRRHDQELLSQSKSQRQRHSSSSQHRSCGGSYDQASYTSYTAHEHQRRT